MATTLISGKDCKLKIGSTEFSDIINSFEVTFDSTSAEYQTLTDTYTVGGAETGSLSITFANDIDDPSGLFQTLWAAVGTSITYEAVAGTQALTGDAIAVRPGLSASAGEVSSIQVTLPLNGMPTLGAPATAKAPKAAQ